MKGIVPLMMAGLCWSLTGCSRTAVATGEAPETQRTNPPAARGAGGSMSNTVVKSEAEWRKQLTPEQYRVLREKGTERAFTGAYWNHHEAGKYTCAGCGQELFASDTKFDSGCGWPSFYAPRSKEGISTQGDLSHGMDRVEVMCSKCGGHLGHVFEDGPKPTGLRYCINSVSIKFEKKDSASKTNPEPSSAPVK